MTSAVGRLTSALTKSMVNVDRSTGPDQWAPLADKWAPRVRRAPGPAGSACWAKPSAARPWAEVWPRLAGPAKARPGGSSRLSHGPRCQRDRRSPCVGFTVDRECGAGELGLRDRLRLRRDPVRLRLCGPDRGRARAPLVARTPGVRRNASKARSRSGARGAARSSPNGRLAHGRVRWARCGCMGACERERVRGSASWHGAAWSA